MRQVHGDEHTDIAMTCAHMIDVARPIGHYSFWGFVLLRLVLLGDVLAGVLAGAGSSFASVLLNFFIGVRLMPVRDEDFLGAAFSDATAGGASSDASVFCISMNAATALSSIIGNGCVIYGAK